MEFSNLPQEHAQLIAEFEYLYQELEEFRHFDQVMDSGIVQRVRELKQSLAKVVLPSQRAGSHRRME